MRNTVNVIHYRLREPLNMFYVGLKLNKINHEIFTVNKILNRIVHLIPSIQSLHIIECSRCKILGTRKHITMNLLNSLNVETLIL